MIFLPSICFLCSWNPIFVKSTNWLAFWHPNMCRSPMCKWKTNLFSLQRSSYFRLSRFPKIMVWILDKINMIRFRYELHNCNKNCCGKLCAKYFKIYGINNGQYSSTNTSCFINQIKKTFKGIKNWSLVQKNDTVAVKTLHASVYLECFALVKRWTVQHYFVIDKSFCFSKNNFSNDWSLFPMVDYFFKRTFDTLWETVSIQ